jgi:F-type H+-transporting ATPase subunit b
MQGAEENAEAIIKEATVRAERRSEKIIEEAKEKADVIVRGAQAEALLERKKATEGIKREIVDVSSCLSEKILEREIKKEDHQRLIDSFISEIGDGNE